jgi:hypothetical protein
MPTQLSMNYDFHNNMEFSSKTMLLVIAIHLGDIMPQELFQKPVQT